jgi:hypothetical protein
MLVPDNLLLPQVYIDQAYGQLGLLRCEDYLSSEWQAAYLEVGGTLKVVPNTMLQNGWGSLNISPFVNFLAVLVNGKAPDEISDWNGDGFVNEKDLLHHGYVLLSNPETFTVEMTFQEFDVLSFAFQDFDGNGVCQCGIVTPAGSVNKTPPPR